jgi:hypothetical protein
MDHIPMTNIMSFDAVDTRGPTVNLAFFPTLDNTSKLRCLWAGVIQFVDAGEVTVNVA